MSKRQITLLLFLLCVGLCAPVGAFAQTLHYGFEPDEDASLWQMSGAMQDSTAFEGSYIGHVEKHQEYALNVGFPFPDSASLHNHLLEVSGRFRTTESNPGAMLVVSVVRGDSLLCWQGTRLGDFAQSPGQWFHVSASLKLPADVLVNSKLSVYLWNRQAETWDADQISINLSPLASPSYVPPVSFSEVCGNPVVLLQLDNVQLHYYPEGKLLVLADRNGVAMSKPLTIQTMTADSTLFECAKWIIERRQVRKSLSRVILRNDNQLFKTRMTIEADHQRGSLHFSFVCKPRQHTPIYRHSLILGYLDTVSEIYTPEGFALHHSFADEYYLGQGGIRVGKSARSLLVYHPDNISSMQAKLSEKLISINLDFAADHPLLHYPLAKDTADYFVDVSAMRYRARQRIHGEFMLYAGVQHPDIACFTRLPNGFEAGIVWTEHADWTDIRTQRAVNFGSEQITQAGASTGGFVNYGIPVTKSVFYNNPDQVTNQAISGGMFDGPVATIMTDTAFYGFLKQLQAKGHEICLHTPEQFTTTARNLKKALGFMQDNFASPVWIDHGYNNKPQNNREDMVCDGLDITSANYAAKGWSKTGIKYLWNPYAEEFHPYADWAFEGNLMIPYPGFGQAFPLPLLSKIPGDEKLFSWHTTGTLEVPEERLWDFYFSPSRLGSLINHRSIWINHVYPAWVTPEKGFWTYDQEGRIVAEPGFNSALKRIAALRESGKLLPLTAGELMKYTFAIQHIIFRIQDAQTIVLHNPTSEAIRGVSMATSHEDVWVNGQRPMSRKSGEEWIFWFDMAPQSSATIRYDAPTEKTGN